MTIALSDLVLEAGVNGVAEYPAGATFGPREAHDYEFVWIERGEALWEVDGRELPVTGATVTLTRPGMRDGFRWARERRTAHGYIHFRIRAGAEMLGDPTGWPLVCEDGADLLLPVLRAALQHDREGEVEALEHCLRLALLAFVRPPRAQQSGTRADHPAVARALQVLADAWHGGPATPLTLGELAARSGVSENHLIRLFREDFGETPQTVQRLLRLERASTLLARSELPIQDVAAECGFTCPFHFSKAFRAAYGASPRRFRQGLRRGEHGRQPPLMRFWLPPARR